MPSLFVIQGRDQGRRFDLPATPLTIGRDVANQIQLRDQEASRRHAEFHGEDGQYEVVDLQSSNGTWINGKKVDRATLKTGDRLQIGRTLLLFTGTSVEDSHSVISDVDIVRSRGDSNSRI